MDKERHLVHDSAFEVYERASYGHGCEIKPAEDEKHKKCECKETVFLVVVTKRTTFVAREENTSNYSI